MPRRAPLPAGSYSARFSVEEPALLIARHGVDFAFDAALAQRAFEALQRRGLADDLPPMRPRDFTMIDEHARPFGRFLGERTIMSGAQDREGRVSGRSARLCPTPDKRDRTTLRQMCRNLADELQGILDITKWPLMRKRLLAAIDALAGAGDRPAAPTP